MNIGAFEVFDHGIALFTGVFMGLYFSDIFQNQPHGIVQRQKHESVLQVISFERTDTVI